MRGPHYHPDLGLVVISPDGTQAASCVSSIDEAHNERTGHNENEIAIVDTRPDFRKQGLGRKMMLAGMHGLKEHGIEVAMLGVASSKTAAIRLCDSMGLQKQFQKR
jgi:ribosomal protein S18 acetylase RimI-like enzyme